MMKRAVYIVCMLLANIGIVAHALVPHHHRCELLTTIVSLLDGEEGESCPHATDAVPIHHHHSGESGECQIDGSYTAPRIQNEDNNPVPDDVVQDTEGPFPIDCADCTYAARFFPQQQGLRYKPYAAGVFLDYAAASIGLRAPPQA